jgi:hypothetical protein
MISPILLITIKINLIRKINRLINYWKKIANKYLIKCKMIIIRIKRNWLLMKPSRKMKKMFIRKSKKKKKLDNNIIKKINLKFWKNNFLLL